MHRSVCSGETITQTRDMCHKVETLPGVLLSHFPLGQGGLAVIDDKFVDKPEEDCASCGGAPASAAPFASAPAPAPASVPAEEAGAAAAPPPEEEPPVEGGAEGGEVASGMDASARRRS
eukprot:1639336-Rhodomonas_salina.1